MMVESSASFMKCDAHMFAINFACYLICHLQPSWLFFVS